MSYKTEGNPLSSLPTKDFLFQVLKTWYQQHKRDLPWRHTTDPYLIWLSEIILQQTRVAQGLPYYQKFTERFPTIKSFSEAPEDEILRLWQGLGYYSRARNMMQTAQQIMLDFGGVFPNNFDSLKKLKGVGDYTAAAIASFAYQEATPVVDGNVYRVLSRLLGIHTDISSPKAKLEFTSIAKELISAEEPAIFNQAIMEFGALQCTPSNPNCTVCPLQDVCYAYQHNAQKELPVKLKKVKITQRFLNYVLVQKDGAIAMQKRTKKDVWSGLYEFVLIETPTAVADWDELITLLPSYLQNSITLLQSASNPVIHQLSHQKLQITFWPLQIDSQFAFPADANYSFYTPSEIEILPKPIVLDNYLKKDFF